MNKLKLYTPAELKASGWLKRQLEIQAESLSGNLDKIWPDIRDSRWVGGNCEGWERVPYWLDGFIPLAYLLDDEDKIARAKRFIDAIVAGQKEDGWLCPCTDEERGGYDMWALYLIDKVLMLYYDCSGDERIPEVVYKSLKNLKAHIEQYPIFAWAHSRWFECLIPIFAIYEMYPEEWLLDLARLLKKQGMDYEGLYADWPHKEPENVWRQTSHVVNQGMAIKAGGLSSILENGEIDDSFSEFMLDNLFTYHGTAVGHFTGDECLSGFSPIQGTELCSVTEAMYSYEVLYSFTKNPIWADRLEKLAYNALPATITPDMWAHQYDQMTNQIACVRLEKPIFRTNSGESHLYGLEPNFGCCTANFNQGWPKFAMSTFMKADDGVTVCALAPAVLNTKIGGKAVKIEAETLYPFGNVVNYIVTADEDVDFTLTLRIPACAASAEIDGEAAEPGTMVSLKRTWSGTSVVTLKLGYEIKLADRPTGFKTIERGPLVYALAIGEDWTKLEYVRNNVERKFPYCDWEVRPTTEWQYALADSCTCGIDVNDTGVIGDMPFAPETAAISLEVPVRRINWGFEPGYKLIARREPMSAMPIGPVEKVKFIPYGCTNIRLTELPVAEVME
ncbi:MAG: glycoside hydrolase family 127 protein [Clostridia bacterium]|nr:glycoside hydrolase family 127 protein [Clostridia bacterium]